MYSTYYSTSGSSVDVFSLIIMITILICYIVAWVLAMRLVTQIARDKGYSEHVGELWFIGLFGLIVTPAIIVAALPDKRVRQITMSNSLDSSEEDDLPSL